MSARRGIKLPNGFDIRLPNPRISQFPKTPERLMGPGPAVKLPGSTPSERPYFFGPLNGLGFQTFTEIYREVVKGFEHGRIIVGADVTVDPVTAATLVRPFLYIDVQIIGYLNGVPGVLAYGAPGSIMLGLNGAYPTTRENKTMDAPPTQAEWDDSMGFDEIAVNIRTMGNGGQPFGAGWVTNPLDVINVNITGKLWR